MVVLTPLRRQLTVLSLVTLSLLLLPTPVPAQSSSSDVCRICGDDSFLPEPFRPVTNQDNNLQTVCANMEAIANDNDAASANTRDCAFYQSTYAGTCCTVEEPIEDDGFIFCPICSLPGEVPQDPVARFDMGGSVTITCETAQSLSIRLPPFNCSQFQSIGNTVCACAEVEQPDNDCTLCDSGEALPQPLLLIGNDDKTCVKVQVEAKRDDPLLCADYQQTYGEYCGCDNVPPPQKQVCRLCGGETRLPRPLQAIPLVGGDNGEELEKTCGRLEWEANAIADCANYQELYGGDDGCCQGATRNNGDDDEDAAATSLVLWTTTILLAPAIAVLMMIQVAL
jgi:hypothetical protein